jgi:hypothetical protein
VDGDGVGPPTGMRPGNECKRHEWFSCGRRAFNAEFSENPEDTEPKGWPKLFQGICGTQHYPASAAKQVAEKALWSPSAFRMTVFCFFPQPVKPLPEGLVTAGLMVRFAHHKSSALQFLAGSTPRPGRGVQRKSRARTRMRGNSLRGARRLPYVDGLALRRFEPRGNLLASK